MTSKQQNSRSVSTSIALLLAFMLLLPAIAAAQVYTAITFGIFLSSGLQTSRAVSTG